MFESVQRLGVAAVEVVGSLFSVFRTYPVGLHIYAALLHEATICVITYLGIPAKSPVGS